MSAERSCRVRAVRIVLAIVTASLMGGCFGGKGGPSGVTATPPVVNTVAIIVDTGPAAATGAVNRPYVTVQVCAAGSPTQCANIDHVLVDTGSWGLRLVRSTLTAESVTLSAETDAQGNSVEECATFGSGQTWGPVALADVSLAGERAARIPVQVMDDTLSGAAAPAACGTSGLINGVADWSANGVLGIGVFAQDCGESCAGTGAPLPVYYGCSAAGACTAENLPLAAQVTNPAWAFGTDNNGVMITMANLQNSNGDLQVSGQLIFGLATQSDNALPLASITLLAADTHGDFLVTYNDAVAPVPGLIDSGSDAYLFDDQTIAVCASAAWVGYYCPANAPLVRTAINASAVQTAAGVSGPANTVSFAVADPDSFIQNAAAYGGLAGGSGAAGFTWGMPFFYGRPVFIGFEGRSASSFTGPFYGY